MKKLSPDRELDTFRKRASDSYRRYVELYEAVGASSSATDLRRGLATDAAFRLGTEWESLQHRWHIAAISVRPHRLIEQHLTMVSKRVSSLDEATRDVFGVSVTPSKKTSLTRAEIESLVNDDGKNVTFRDSAEWAKKSAGVLAGTCNARIKTITQDETQSSLLDLLKALRNAIAHGSTNATGLLTHNVRPRGDGLVGLVGAQNEPFVIRKSSPRDLGKYLHAWTHDPQTDRLKAEGSRMTLLHRRVLAISENLRL